MATQTMPAHAGTAAAPAAPPTAPFRVGTQNTTMQDGYVNTTALSAATQQLPVYNPTANSFLRGLYLISTAVGANSSNAVAFAGDGPWNVYQNISFNDTQGKPIILVDGYRLMLINKFGGYHNLGDPRASAMYSTTTTAVATGGSWSFVLYIPLEIVSRDGIGSLQNKNQASPFQLTLTLNSNANVFATLPNTSCTVTTTMVEDGWQQPKAADAQGNPLAQTPPAPNTTSYWLQTTYNALNGSQQVQLTGGLGYPVRNIILANYGASALTRAAGDPFMPNPTELLYKGQILKNISPNFWKDAMARTYRLTTSAVASGVIAPTYDSANGLEQGVFVLPFNMDFDLGAGAELRNGYLVTQQGDQFQLIGNFSGNSNLYELVNYVAPGNGNPTSLRSSR